MTTSIDIIECPRDAMQGIERHIPTQLKIDYINQLLQVGFHTIDFGSFVSPKAIPQMADTAQVLAGLNLDDTDTKLLAIVANMRGANDACSHPEIDYLGYPFSISETFQLRNTRKTIADSLVLVEAMQELCQKNNKELVVYLSMAFGNPYGDPWDAGIVEKWATEMSKMGIGIISLADTVGTADAASIRSLFAELIPRFPEMTVGAHFHAAPTKRIEKISAAFESGCTRFDGALMGFGGCPFAEDELVGNIATEVLMNYLVHKGVDLQIKSEFLSNASELANQIFLAH
jgi:hydroxymethylglutaryl-CoA lyase